MPPEYQEEEFEIDLKELLIEILGHWKIVLLTTILVGAIAYVASRYIIIPQYQSTSELFVLSKSTSITSLADIQTGTSLTNDYLVVAKERPVIEQVIENLGLDETYDTLRGKISVNNPSDSRLLQITVTDTDNDRAKDIADEMAKMVQEYIAEKMNQDPPNITYYGYSDWEPVSPNILKNTVIGCILGMLLAIAIVALSYLLNDSIMTPEDLEKKVGINLLGALPLEEKVIADEPKRRRKKKNKKEKKG